MNFDDPDMRPEYELNEILWKSVRGAASPMPPPVRLLRIIEHEDEESSASRPGGR